MTRLQTPEIIYPETDGKPMAENTLQFEWIVTIQGGLATQYASNTNVFVAGDLFWYPVEGHPEIVQALNAMVAFGRPQGHRASYRQWEEGGVAPQIVFEVLSPGNRFGEMQKKFLFYQQHGVDEYYIYDPDRLILEGWRRVGAELQDIERMAGWTSPRLGIRFEMTGAGLQLYHPNGARFLTFLEIEEQRVQAERDRKLLEAERDQEKQERQIALWEHDQEIQKRLRIEQERQKAEQAQNAAQRIADKLRAQLRALGIEPQE